MRRLRCRIFLGSRKPIQVESLSSEMEKPVLPRAFLCLDAGTGSRLVQYEDCRQPEPEGLESLPSLRKHGKLPFLEARIRSPISNAYPSAFGTAR